MTAAARIERIVVGVDGSRNAEAALKWAMSFAGITGAEVVAVYAQHVAVYGVSGYEPALQFDPEWRDAIKRAFEDEWCAELKRSGLCFRTVFEDGRPATVLADVAERLDADLVVVGRRGRGTVAELMLGSVSHELSHHCRRPVVLISESGEGSKRDVPAATAERQASPQPGGRG